MFRFLKRKENSKQGAFEIAMQQNSNLLTANLTELERFCNSMNKSSI